MSDKLITGVSCLTVPCEVTGSEKDAPRPIYMGKGGYLCPFCGANYRGYLPCSKHMGMFSYNGNTTCRVLLAGEGRFIKPPCMFCVPEKTFYSFKVLAQHVQEKHQEEARIIVLAAKTAPLEDSLASFSGKTQDASAPILAADFWKKGTRISGKVLRAFTTENGTCYTIQLPEKISVKRTLTYPKAEGTEMLDKVSVGSLKGFEMALSASGVPDGKLQVYDEVVITCTGKTPSGKGSDQVDFSIDISR